MYEHMVHPVLTIMFDVFIIGSALAVASAMLGEYLLSREPQVGTSRRYEPRYQAARPKRRTTITRLPAQRRRPEPRRAA